MFYVNLNVLNMNAQQVDVLSNVFWAPTTCRVTGTVAQISDFNRSPGFWLCDGGATRKCHVRVQESCKVWRHSKRNREWVRSDSESLRTV
jgi:hypothetical protein